MDTASASASTSTSTTTSKSKRKLFGTLFSHFQVELFLFVFIFSIAVEDVTVTLLAQDKFCMARFNRSDLCANLSKIQAPKPGNEDGDNVDSVDGGFDGEDLLPLLHAKDEILQQVTTFNFYQSVIYTVPVIFSSMFLSGWADRHRSSTKTLLCLTALAAALESIVVLICAVYFDSSKSSFGWSFRNRSLDFLVKVFVCVCVGTSSTTGPSVLEGKSCKQKIEIF